MAKNYEEVAMDVIREDWEFRKTQHNASFNQERIARMMGISRSQFRAIDSAFLYSSPVKLIINDRNQYE